MEGRYRGSGGEAILQVLRVHQVEHIFSSPGSEWPPVWEELARLKALEEGGPRYITCRHEELAVAMASGYARATGRLPLVLLHTTVGTLHGAMALRAAYHEQVPMVVCAGESVTFGERPGLEPGSQWLRFLSDIGGPARLVEPYVKWSAKVSSSETLPGTLYRACQIALAPPQGPVFLSIPLENMLEEVEAPPIPTHPALVSPSHPDPRTLEAVAEMLLESQNPVVITENLGRHPEAVSRLVELAELLSIPVVESLSPGYFNFPKDHPLHGGYDAKPFLKEADVVFLVATAGPWHPPSAGPGDGAKVIVLDDNPLRVQEPYQGYKEDVIIAAHVPSALDTLVDMVRSRLPQRGERASLRKERLARHKASRERRSQEWRDEALAVKDRKPIDPRWLCHVINQTVPQDAVVVEETIVHRPLIFRYLERPGVSGYFSGMSGGLGTGLGIALGIKLAFPHRLAVCLIGDGAFNYNPTLPALGFCQEYRLPILILLFNNRSYASMRSSHLRYYPEGWASRTGTFYGVDIQPRPDYAALLKAFDGYGETVEDPQEIQPALLRAIEQVQKGRPALVDFILESRDPRQ